MKQVYKIYQDAPPIGKVLIIVSIMVILFLIYKGVSKLLAPKDSNQTLLDSSTGELKNLSQTGVTPQYSSTQYASWADSLEQAMSGLGTDEDSISKVFDYMQNKADVLSLIKAFGIRDYTDDRVFIYNTKSMNLAEWLSAEMDGADIDYYVNDPLKKKGIDYKF